jgi:hypothetical protein
MYYDGMFWSSALVVPWRYFHAEDELVKVSFERRFTLFHAV